MVTKGFQAFITSNQRTSPKADCRSKELLLCLPNVSWLLPDFPFADRRADEQNDPLQEVPRSFGAESTHSQPLGSVVCSEGLALTWPNCMELFPSE